MSLENIPAENNTGKKSIISLPATSRINSYTNRTNDDCNDNMQIWSSIASSSALVSESIVDAFPHSNLKNRSSRIVHSSTSTRTATRMRTNQNSSLTENATNTNHSRPTEKGINRHKYSAESICRILEDGHHDHHQEEEDETLQEKTFMSRATDSFLKWVHLQKMKRQKEALEQAVEKQRNILLQEALRSMRQRDEKRMKHNLKQHPPPHPHPQQYFDVGLEGNETFQNITSRERTLPSLSFCGGGTACVNDDDYTDEYYDDESRESGSFDEYISSVQNCTYVSSSGDGGDDLDCDEDNTATGPNYCDDESGIGYYRQNISFASSKDHDTFRIGIGKPCHTVSGQGVAVQLEILEEATTSTTASTSQQHLNQSNDEIVSINVQNEQNSVPFILNTDQMRAIAFNGLPASIAYSKWIRLYCLQRDGDSFINSFLRKVRGVERTLLVIQTTNYEILGGYSNSPWESQSGSVGAAFYGSCQASLYKIDKKTGDVQVFPWTGSNRYVQVCDISSKLLAFGGGGKDGSFGLCIEDDFRVGTTGKCETFDNDPLCEEERFEILNVECWGFTTAF
jgi:hypothetical protein